MREAKSRQSAAQQSTRGSWRGGEYNDRCFYGSIVSKFAASISTMLDENYYAEVGSLGAARKPLVFVADIAAIGR
jgi:hypothetical protein